ncbi:MAG: hypothetical protein ACK4TB_06115 [Gemmobacter sp.]
MRPKDKTERPEPEAHDPVIGLAQALAAAELGLMAAMAGKASGHRTDAERARAEDAAEAMFDNMPV